MYNHIQYSIITKAVGGRYVRDVHPHGRMMSPLRLQQVQRLHELAEPGKRPSADHPKRSQKIEGSQPGRHGGPFEAYDKLRQRKQAKKKVEVLSWNRKILCSSSKPNLAGRFLPFLSCSVRSLQWKDSVLGPRVQGSGTNRILKSPWTWWNHSILSTFQLSSCVSLEMNLQIASVGESGWSSMPFCKHLASEMTWLMLRVLCSINMTSCSHYGFKNIGNIDTIWVCLKIGYIPNYSHLIGIMIINQWVHYFQTHPY